MLQRILIINGILIVAIASFGLLNKHSEVDTAVAKRMNQNLYLLKNSFVLKMKT